MWNVGRLRLVEDRVGLLDGLVDSAAIAIEEVDAVYGLVYGRQRSVVAKLELQGKQEFGDDDNDDVIKRGMVLFLHRGTFKILKW